MTTLSTAMNLSVVFLLDVDNTLLDNDGFAADLDAHLAQVFGAAERARYWALYAEVRGQLGYADYLATLQQFRIGLDDDPALLRISAFLLDYPFAARLYPRALEAIAHLRTLGLPVVLSDGDVVFQPRKIQRSGIWDAVEGRVLIYLHKERMLPTMQQRFPASHYVMVDDKPQLLAAMKQALGDKLTTVFVRQGHYAAAAGTTIDPAPDRTIEHIGNLCDRDLLIRHANNMNFLASAKSDCAWTNKTQENWNRRRNTNCASRSYGHGNADETESKSVRRSA